MTSDRFRPHVLEWSPERTARFWDWRSAQGEAGYFSAMAGNALLGLVRSTRVAVSGRVLDFGCGMGHFMAALCDQGLECEGADFSKDSVEAAAARLASLGCSARVSQLRGFPTQFDGDAFDLVFLLETIEHLGERDRDETLTELSRIIRPGGALVVTTPNREDVDGHRTLCPDCGAIFHPIQHVSTWSRDTLASCINGYGFGAISVREYYLLKSWRHTQLATWAGRIFGRTLPNLVYVGRKPLTSAARIVSH